MIIHDERFWEKVQKTDSCWEWTGSLTSAGYGNKRVGSKNDYAHRIAYRLVRGEIPDGLVLDHLCRNRKCVNPDHLEAVKHSENVRRGAVPYGPLRPTCRQGHDVLDPANVYTRPDGSSLCRVCASAQNDKRRALRHARGDQRKRKVSKAC